MTNVINGSLSERSSTHGKIGDVDYTRVTKSKCRVDNYALRMHPYFSKTGKIKVLLFNKERKKEKKYTGLFVTCTVG